jgi:hypothetical protein
MLVLQSKSETSPTPVGQLEAVILKNSSFQRERFDLTSMTLLCFDSGVEQSDPIFQHQQVEMFGYYYYSLIFKSRTDPDVLSRIFPSTTTVYFFNHILISLSVTCFTVLKKLNSVALVRKRTIPTERPPLSAK